MSPPPTLVRADSRRIPLADGVVHVIVTSPPYYGLRAYDGNDSAEIGREQTPADYIGALVEVMRECRRVLRDDGVCWLNIGDSYCTDSKWGGASGEKNGDQGGGARREQRITTGLASGNALLLPHRVAIALQDDGWIVRSDSVWSKLNPLPESIQGWRWEQCRVKVRASLSNRDPADAIVPNNAPTRGTRLNVNDAKAQRSNAGWACCPGCSKCSASGGYVLRRGTWRPTRAHEYVFMLAKSGSYYSDGTAVREAASDNKPWSARSNGGDKAAEVRNDGNTYDGLGKAADAAMGRNARSVITMPSAPSAFDYCFRCATFYAGPARRAVVKRDDLKWCPKCEAAGDWVDHFALMPPKLVAWCLRTGPTQGCSECGVPWARVVERNGWKYAEEQLCPKHLQSKKTGLRQAGWSKQPPPTVRDLGHRPTCSCSATAVPPLVLDPFCGAGTTLATAAAMGWRFLGTDLSQRYLSLARGRIEWAREHPEKFTGAQAGPENGEPAGAVAPGAPAPASEPEVAPRKTQRKAGASAAQLAFALGEQQP